MLKPLIHFAAYGFALLALCGLGYLMLSLWSEWRFLKRRRAAGAQAVGGFTPPVSILKPLRGTDRQMYESFRSHCLQDYPQYEIVFGVNDANDEAVAEVERLRREFPEHEIRLVVCPEPMGSNRKVSNLAQMMKAAKYEYIVVNDSDIRVERDYLRRIVAPMQMGAQEDGHLPVPGGGRAQFGFADGGGDDCHRLCRRGAVRGGVGGRTALRAGLDAWRFRGRRPRRLEGWRRWWSIWPTIMNWGG